jgi:hypothetical protein
MFDRLADEIEAMEIPVERDAIVDAVRLRDRFDGKVTEAVGAFGAAGLHEVDGSVTLSTWLGHRAGLAPDAASRTAKRAGRLARLPVLRAALVSGLLSGGAVDVVLGKLVNRHVDRFAEHEGELVPLLVGLSTDAVARAMADWRARADALDPGPAPVDLPDTVHLSPTLDDRGLLSGSLGADSYNVVATAMRVFDCGDFTLPLAQRQALALVQACQTALDFNPATKHRRHRPHLTVTVRQNGSATYLDTGMRASRYGLDTLCCDGAWHHLTFEGRAAILRYSRTIRDWPPDLYNLIAARDSGCRWPGCTAPVHWCDVHHVQYWEHGGPTDVDNGVLLCRRHHRKLHSKEGWSFKLLPDGTGELTAPDGTTEESLPRGLDPPRLPLPPV